MRSELEPIKFQQYACEVFAKMPHIKPSPPARAAIGGISMEYTEGFDDSELLFLPQQITVCFPLASMAQKKLLSPNAAEMEPIDPNPDANPVRKRKQRREVVKAKLAPDPQQPPQ
ncbi:hypothetical protein RJ639_034490 [Escallonia herrerae]|uniref:Uncharacterized protein n=1 Tax=Escallonia herrerae TaxID=1293975 RepID=A0AA88X0K4_9ASTE|nr:hypothetical protein RJ639_034490 [Escallonia herrerae]